MRVLLAHKFFRVTGGAEVFFFETARVLQKYGHEVAFFSTEDSSNKDSDFGRFFVAPAYYPGMQLYSSIKNFSKMIYYEDAYRKFTELIEFFKPDIINVFSIQTQLSPSLLVAARAHGVPVVMSCNDYKHICPNYKLYHHERICFDCKGGGFYHALINRCCKNSVAFSLASMLEAYAHDYMGIYEKYVDRFLFSSEFMRSITLKFWRGRDIKTGLVRNPFNSLEYEISEKDAGYALYFGRLAEEKGVDVLIEAAKQMPNIPIKVVGDGPELEKLKKSAATIGNVEFMGALWGDNLLPVLKACRLVVVPSRWHENFPYVINQAFAVGKPIVGSNRGGIPELVSHGTRGLIYDADSAEELASSLSLLMQQPELAKKMGRSAKCWSDELFNESNFYSTLIDQYRETKDAFTCHRR